MAVIWKEGPSANLGYENVYTSEQLVTHNNTLWLEVSLGGRTILLPMVNVGDPKEPRGRGIAFYVPEPHQNRQVAEASVQEMQMHLRALNAGLVARTDSSKSGWFIEKAAKSLGVEVVNFPSGRDVRDVMRRSTQGDSVKSYTPVTLLATGEQKYMGTPADLDAKIAKIRSGKKLVIAEDVATTFATLGAMEGILEPWTSCGLPHSIAVIAREGELGVNYPPVLPTNMRASIAIPEIDGLDASKMVHVTDRGHIPKAIVK